MKGSNLSDCSIYVSSLKGGWRGRDGRENEVAGGGREADTTGKEEAWLRISRPRTHSRKCPLNVGCCVDARSRSRKGRLVVKLR